MAYTKYSLTPANNNATPPDGAPEGMLPSAVNDTMRDMMAQIRDCGDGIRDGTYTMTAPKITGGSITGATVTLSTIINTGTLTLPTSTDTLVGRATTDTLTNKTITTRVSSTASISSPLAWNSDNFDQYVATAQSGALTINADSGNPTDGRKIVFRIKDNGTARALTWTTGSSKSFRAVGLILPTTTVVNKTLYVGCIYNSADSRWDVVGLAQEI
jgi:hypothetical protein